MRKYSRSVSIYYRDENKVMQKIKGVKVFIHRGHPVKVYTLPPVEVGQEIDLTKKQWADE